MSFDQSSNKLEPCAASRCQRKINRLLLHGPSSVHISTCPCTVITSEKEKGQKGNYNSLYLTEMVFGSV
jgi:hypothetical protein